MITDIHKLEAELKDKCARDLAIFERAKKIQHVSHLIKPPRNSFWFDFLGIGLPKCPYCKTKLRHNEWYWKERQYRLAYRDCPKCNYEYAHLRLFAINKYPGGVCPYWQNLDSYETVLKAGGMNETLDYSK